MTLMTCQCLIIKLKKIENKHVPMIEVTNKKKFSFSVDKNTRDKIKEKNRLAKKYMRYKNPQDRKKCNTARNKVKSMVAKQRKIFEERIAANAKDNPKVIYQYINSKYKTRTAVGTLCKDPNNKNSDKTEDDQEKANILSEYFASNFVKEPLRELPTLETRKLKSQMKPLKIDQATNYISNLK